MIEIAGRKVGLGEPVFIVAELSANARTRQEAIELIRQAKFAGADAIKTQAYQPSSLTIDCDNEHFQIKSGPWKGQTLWRLYEQAAMPREWHKTLADYTESLGMVYFSTAFCPEDVDFLESLQVPCHKVASFEITDTPLIRYMLRTRKPLIISTGMATQAEILGVMRICEEYAYNRHILLQCTSAYPASVADANLGKLAWLCQFARVAGISDHTLGIAVPVAAVALGAAVIEKHLTLSRDNPTPDAAFSLEPQEFKAMVEAVRDCEAALGEVRFGPTESEAAQLPFRRSLFVVEDMLEGEEFTRDNVRSIRPAGGLHPGHLDSVLGSITACDIKRGTPLAWGMKRPAECAKFSR